MHFGLEQQIDALSLKIKEALTSKADLPKDVLNLIQAQKALVETMLIARHLDEKAAASNHCGGCNHED